MGERDRRVQNQPTLAMFTCSGALNDSWKPERIRTKASFRIKSRHFSSTCSIICLVYATWTSDLRAAWLSRPGRPG